MNENRSLVLFLFCFPRVDIKNGRGPPLRIQPPLPKDSEQSPMSASVIRQAHGGFIDQAFSVWAEWGTWVFDFGFRSTIHQFTAIKKKTNSNTVYSKQYLKSIGLRSSSIYYYTFFSLVPGEGRPTFTHTQKLLTIWAQCICLSRNDCGIPSSLPSLSAMDPWMWKWIASCEGTCLSLCLLIPNAIDGQISWVYLPSRGQGFILGPRGKICG